MHKIIAVLAVGVGVGLLIAGCGSNNAEPETAKSANTASAANSAGGPPPIVKDLASKAVPPGGVMPK